ncbi:aminoglycoside adenylyltransferase domain-containing protein [Clostridium intestinale]|uniref:aminoglycoside adenylyltransferase domain-containing protein n=1 Tax=Clostridium intestinale TaxID=36845 RepID=UPI0028E564E9|nr:aminoglycoside adenylyltransferase domain-containing protein [Clostridium intestinale]
MNIDIPKESKEQINKIIDLCKGKLKESLVGVYLHGSLAMGCFNKDKSDIDIIVVMKEPICDKENMINEFMKISLKPSPIEISFLLEDKLKNPNSTCYYDLHYSEYWREKYTNMFLENKELGKDILEDGDLPAHIRVINERGITLWGKDKDLIFPKISNEEYLKSILDDFEDAWEGFSKKSEYYILNTCRILNFLETNKVTSKREAGEWALDILPARFRTIIKSSLDIYDGRNIVGSFNNKLIEKFLAYANENIMKNIEEKKYV